MPDIQVGDLVRCRRVRFRRLTNEGVWLVLQIKGGVFISQVLCAQGSTKIWVSMNNLVKV